MSKLSKKILRSLTDNFNFVVCSIEESKDIDDLTADELQASLLVHEQKVIEKRSEEQVLQVENEQRNVQGRGRGIYQRGNNNFRGGNFRGGNFRGRGRGRSFVNRSAINCFRCGKQGHYQFECSSLEKGVNYTKFDEEEELLLMAHTEVSKAEGKGIWFLDSGCSNHMTGDKTWFVEFDESFKHSVRLGNSTRMAVQGKGSIRFEVQGITQTNLSSSKRFDSRHSNDYESYVHGLCKDETTAWDVIFEEGGKWDWNLSGTELKQNALAWGDDEAVTEEFEAEYTDSDVEESEYDRTKELPEAGQSSPEEQTRRERRKPSWMNNYESGEGLSEEEELEQNLAFYISHDDPFVKLRGLLGVRRPEE
ncbi:hypothetical protein KIW84_071251 [Lathyrus oleraceus]|uniref:CCHC-type domain-containing protein n=1 Tax=Pisum sativum TaxID=3888 RepID=A0A9D4ZSX5_PEA|nr:hypothetical protein KIW84_071251 [Pisum sativum]